MRTNNKLEDVVQQLVDKIEQKEKQEREKKLKRKEGTAYLLIVTCGVAIGTVLGRLIVTVVLNG